jgi:hypothetical protein
LFALVKILIFSVAVEIDSFVASVIIYWMSYIISVWLLPKEEKALSFRNLSRPDNDRRSESGSGAPPLE